MRGGKKVQKIFIKYSKKLQIVFKFFGYAINILHGGDTISSLSVSFPSKMPVAGLGLPLAPFFCSSKYCKKKISPGIDRTRTRFRPSAPAFPALLQNFGRLLAGFRSAFPSKY